MKSHEAFPSNYLKAVDLNGQQPVVTITHVTSEDLGGDSKRAAHFKGTEKILILNRTNWNTIAEITGEDDDENWMGQKIRLYATKVDFQGKRTDAIRVDYPKTAPVKPAKNAPVPELTDKDIFNKPPAETVGDDDECPF